MRGIKLIQRLFRKKIKRETRSTLQDLASNVQRQRDAITKELIKLGEGANAPIQLGTTEWGQSVALRPNDFASHALIGGASGSGKSFLVLNFICQILKQFCASKTMTFAILDPKRELFERAIEYVYAFLYRLEPTERERFKKKIVIIDFADTESITPYNILARQIHLADEIMFANRLDTIGEQFSGLSDMSVRMRLILKYFLLLMTEFNLPLPFFERLCADPMLLQVLVSRSANLQVRDYFLHRFDDESKATLLAVRQRIDSLLMSESVRLSLSATTAPDFTTLQDQGAIILITTAGRNISRGVSQMLQSLLLSDIKQSVFRRANPQQKILWFIDEAQEVYKSSVNKEHMVDLLTMARSFGSYFALVTQTLTSAIRDADVLNSIITNVRWAVMLRSTLRDAELIAPGIALTGRLAKPSHSPFEPVKYLTESEELKLWLKEMTKLPDRTAYCWLKAYTDKAVKIMTPRVPAPHEIAGCSQNEFDKFLQSEQIGQGASKSEAIAAIEKRHQHLGELFESPSRLASSTNQQEVRQKKGAQTLLKTLEEEYAKRNE
jgi:hypothetical protein